MAGALDGAGMLTSDPVSDASKMILNDAQRAGRTSLNEWESKQLLSAYGINVPAGVHLQPSDLRSEGIVPERLSALRGPLVVKVMSAGLIHKSDVGGVALGVEQQDVGSVCDRLALNVQSAGYDVESFLVEEQFSGGVEMVVGGVRDPSFGPLLMVGMGGVLVELFEDVSLAACPLLPSDIQPLLRRLHTYKLLEGYRGSPGVKMEVLQDFLLRVGGSDGWWSSLSTMVSQFDLNPVIFDGQDYTVADCSFVLD